MPQGVNMRRCIGSAVSGERAHWRLHELFDRGTNTCGIKSLMLLVIHLGIATSSYLHRCDISTWNICSFRYLDFRCLRGILDTHAFEGILLFSLMLKIIPLPRVSFGVFWRQVEYSTHPFICSAQMFPRGRYKVTLGSLLAHNWYDVVEVYVCRPYHICIYNILCTEKAHVIEIFDGKQESFNQEKVLVLLNNLTACQGIQITAKALRYWDNEQEK